MASLCTRCALRLHRAANSTLTSTRALSTTSSKQKAVPTFTTTSQPELDDVLATFRSKHMIPRMLSNPERKLIFAMKNKQFLEENPQSVTLGDEEIDLQWIDQRTEIPNRRELLKTAMRLMRDGEKSDWNNLPALLIGLRQVKKPPMRRQLAKMIRLAANAGRFGIILQCLHRAPQTGMTMKYEEVLEAVMWALRELGRGSEGGWEQQGLEKAIKDADEIATCLEDEDHGTGQFITANDPRSRPEVLAVFLELAAVYAVKFQDGKDESGRVKAFAERLLTRIDGAEGPRTTELEHTGPQTEILRGVPILHGLHLSQKILGGEMPDAELAARVIQTWRRGLESLTSKLEEQGVKEGSYGEQALSVWRDRVEY